MLLASSCYMYGVLWKINYETLSCLGFIIFIETYEKNQHTSNGVEFDQCKKNTLLKCI